MMDTLKMDIDALLGERWFPKETSFEEDITEYWGEWGVCSEVETLRAVSVSYTHLTLPTSDLV